MPAEAVRIEESPLVEVFSELKAAEWAHYSIVADYRGFADFNHRDPVLRAWPPKSGSVSKPLILPKPEAPKPRDLGYELAAALRARDDVKQEQSEANTEFKARLERLQTQINMLQHDILTGQAQLFTEVAAGE